MVMPFRPPKNEPTIIKKSVSTTSRKVVLRTLMVFPHYQLPTHALRQAKANCPGVRSPRQEDSFKRKTLSRLPLFCSLRFLPRPPVVSPWSARSASRLFARRDPRECDLPAALCLREFASPGDPESVAESSCAAAALRMPGRNPLAAATLRPPVLTRA